MKIQFYGSSFYSCYYSGAVKAAKTTVVAIKTLATNAVAKMNAAVMNCRQTDVTDTIWVDVTTPAAN